MHGAQGKQEDDRSAKAKMIRAAEALFVEKGLEQASLREIANLAGQKNSNAVQYHFGSKEGLLNAVRQRHTARINQRRRELLARLPENPDLRDLLEIVVRPLVECMDHRDGGSNYLHIMAQVLSRPGSSFLPPLMANHDDAILEVMSRISDKVPHLNAEHRLQRMLFIAGSTFQYLGVCLRMREQGRAPQWSAEEICQSLTAMLTAAVQA